MSELERMKAAIVGIVAELMPSLKYATPQRYRLTKMTEGGKFSAQHEGGDKSGYPPIVDGPIRAVPGGNADVKLRKGTSVLVGWVNCDPSDPYLAFVDDSTPPDQLILKAGMKIVLDAPEIDWGGEGGAPIARVGDTVATTGTAAAQTGTITSGSLKVKSA